MGLATAGGAIGEALHKWFPHSSPVGASTPLGYGQALAEGAADSLEFWLEGRPQRKGDDQGSTCEPRGIQILEGSGGRQKTLSLAALALN